MTLNTCRWMSTFLGLVVKVLWSDPTHFQILSFAISLQMPYSVAKLKNPCSIFTCSLLLMLFCFTLFSSFSKKKKSFKIYPSFLFCYKYYNFYEAILNISLSLSVSSITISFLNLRLSEAISAFSELLVFWHSLL